MPQQPWPGDLGNLSLHTLKQAGLASPLCLVQTQVVDVCVGAGAGRAGLKGLACTGELHMHVGSWACTWHVLGSWACT